MSPTTREVAAKRAERLSREQHAIDLAAAAEPTPEKPKDDLPSWAGQDLVYCTDGPRAGAWAFLTHGPGSWTELRRLASVNEETEHTGRTLGYVPLTDEFETHPRWPQMKGRVLLWAPDLAAAAAAKRSTIR